MNPPSSPGVDDDEVKDAEMKRHTLSQGQRKAGVEAQKGGPGLQAPVGLLALTCVASWDERGCGRFPVRSIYLAARQKPRAQRTDART